MPPSPVLYVNSVGVRGPALREGKMFVSRIRRKLKSLSRGFVKVRDRFGVVSSFCHSWPHGNGYFQHSLLAWAGPPTLKMGIHQPLVWIEVHSAAHGQLMPCENS